MSDILRRNGELQRALDTAQAELAAVRSENARLEARVRNAEGYQEELANQTREAQQDHVLLSNDYKNLCVDLKNAQAELAAVREALQGLHDDIAAYVKVNHLGDVHHNLSMLRARQTLEYTAAQSTLFVEALRAQENEACALIVAPPGHEGERECSDIAAQIRARVGK